MQPQGSYPLLLQLLNSTYYLICDASKSWSDGGGVKSEQFVVVVAELGDAAAVASVFVVEPLKLFVESAVVELLQ